MPRDLRTGDPRGFAFVRYMDQRDADDAIDRLDGEYFAGRELRIQVSRLWRCTAISSECKISIAYFLGAWTVRLPGEESLPFGLMT